MIPAIEATTSRLLDAVAGQDEFDQIVSILGDVLAEASERVRK